MPKSIFCLAVFVLFSSTLFAAGEIKYPASGAEANAARITTVDRADFPNKRGVVLKPEIDDKPFDAAAPPDLVFNVQAPKEGRYVMKTWAGVDSLGAEKMKAARGKYQSLMIRFSLDDRPSVERCVFVPWRDVNSVYLERKTDKVTLTGRPQTLRVWLPKGVQLDSVEFWPYTPPRVPEHVQKYEPTVVPPSDRPRLWMNADSLPIVRKRLTVDENEPVWNRYREGAKKPFPFEFTPGVEIGYNDKLEQAAVAKAFVFLMTGDEALGREAVELVRNYLSVVSFGNYLDITREIGRAIYSASLVYDWCYGLMTPEEKESIRKDLLRLADDMEIGWPPFLQTVVNGHGNEMQVSRDLLSMAVALYGDDDEPYKYCAWQMLESLRPMLAYQYRSPRHNQGGAYGPYRFECDMTAAWLLRRMTGREIFDENIKRVPYAWIYSRLPDGSKFTDGDEWYNPEGYRRYANLLNFSYSDDPILKGEYFRQYKAGYDPLRWLLVNDPELEPEPSLESLPTAIDFGEILCGVIARTGWNLDPKSSDVVVEMKGGGTHFANHQHSDAGAFQIYFRGFQVGDLGMYKFYGTPYDYGFAKRSVSHSMMLVYDPDEKFHPRNDYGNDGGQRFHLRHPRTPAEARTDPEYHNGTKIASSFGPDAHRPRFTFFSVDLVGAYSEKVKKYTRSFCFLDTGDAAVPGILLVYDNLTVANSAFKKYWQVNTIGKPVKTDAGIRTETERGGLKGRIELAMLRPKPENRDLEILTGPVDAHRVFGVQYEPPSDSIQAHGSRVMFSPKEARAEDEFLTVLQMVDGDAAALPVAALPVAEVETDTIRAVVVGRRIVSFAKTHGIDKTFTLAVPKDAEYEIVVTGLAPGKWSVRSGDRTQMFDVEAEKSTLYFTGTGPCEIAPVR